MSAPVVPTPSGNGGSVGGSSRAQVHDVGLGRYTGTRRPQRVRYRAVMKHTLASAWRAKFALKGPLMGAGATLLIATVVMIVFGQIQARVRGLSATGLLRADVALYMSFEYFAMWGQLLAVTLGATAIAGDLTRGAFQFYFARPLRAGDYLRGKLLGVGLLIGLPMILGPVILAVIRVALAETAGEMVGLLPLVPKAIIAGLYGTASIVLPSVALGALLRSTVPAQGAYLIYYLLLANLAEAAAVSLDQPLLAALSPRADLVNVTAWLFDQPLKAVSFFKPPPEVPLPVALGVLAVLIGGGLAACVWRVRSVERAGVGGG